MSDFLSHYREIDPTTWVYVSSLMIIGIFFKFGRFWSVRNLDLVLLIVFTPGLLLVHFGKDAQTKARALTAEAPVVQSVAGEQVEVPSEHSNPDDSVESNEGQLADVVAPVAGSEVVEQPAGSADRTPQERELERGRMIERLGFLWLFAVGALLLVRLLLDPTMVRRPLLEPNLTPGGLIFVGCSLFAFLMADVMTGSPSEDDLAGARSANQLMARQEAVAGGLTQHGPGLPLMHVLPSIATNLAPNGQDEGGDGQNQLEMTAKIMSILSHLAVVVGLVLIGYWHFDNIRMGIGAAVLYLLLPYMAQMTGHVMYVLPAALLVWSVLCYRRPELAGMFLGMAMGVVYYPLFLLPLWISFYWQRGLMRFLCGTIGMVAIVVVSLVFTSSGVDHFIAQLWEMFGLWRPVTAGLEGIWYFYDEVYRIPVLASFIALSAALALWPAQKNLGSLISCSAAVMLAAQFWHGYGGGLYIVWYLPLLLLTIFRPNLEDRVALAVLGNGLFSRRRVPVERAA